jgi:hypothetical protein
MAIQIRLNRATLVLILMVSTILGCREGNRSTRSKESQLLFEISDRLWVLSYGANEAKAVGFAKEILQGEPPELVRRRIEAEIADGPVVKIARSFFIQEHRRQPTASELQAAVAEMGLIAKKAAEGSDSPELYRPIREVESRAIKLVEEGR